MRTVAQSSHYFEKRFLEPAITKHSLSAEQVGRMRHLALNAGNPEEGYIIKAPPEMSLGYAFQVALAPVPCLLGMRWQFLVSKGDPFITGDTPVTRHNDRIRPPLAAGVGLRDTKV